MLDINVKATSNNVEITGEIGGFLSLGAIMAILKGIKQILQLDSTEFITICNAIVMEEVVIKHDSEKDK